MSTTLLNKTKSTTGVKALQTTQDSLDTCAEDYATAVKLLKTFEEEGGYKALKASESKAKKALLAEIDSTLDATETLQIICEEGVVKVGAKAKSRVITDKDKVLDFIGAETFINISKVSLTDIDAYLTPEQKEQVLESSQTGARKITVS